MFILLFLFGFTFGFSIVQGTMGRRTWGTKVADRYLLVSVAALAALILCYIFA
jgi:hypothetical protein